MRGNAKIKFYFGFLDGSYSKAIFLLFCSLLVFPINYDGDDDIAWFFKILAMFLVAVSVTQLIKICTGTPDDSTNHDTMMDEDAM